ncbi:MAG: adenylate/guanylate cyclase domain-containing protein, partial [Clostridia bacterium]|nr:adenylate/guanylate cyclase domain-containing protein [Deltaproteobacteria bacterium]
SVLALSIAALFIYSSITLGRLVISPLHQIMASMRKLRDGDLNTRLGFVDRNDEIGVLADTYNFMVQGLSERERLKDAFNRYVSKQVYKRLEEGAITLTGETREATILFSDIRSFTALSEQLSPPDVVAMLNEYFNEMVEIVFRYDGFLNKFIGDALMAVYNVPIEQTVPELRAVRTALEMLDALHRLNGVRVSRGQFPLRIGIGINTGPVTAGNIGHMQRLEYTVIGDAVNLAQRVESQTKVTGSSLLITASTHAKIAPYVIAEALPAVKMKGKQEAVALYAVSGLKPGAPPGR